MQTSSASSGAGVRAARGTAFAGRVVAVDLLRGLVMALMALDHVRDFFGTGSMDPRDVANAPLFLTRWVTHFCAPVFVFLSGVSARLQRESGTPLAEVRRMLLKRGLWLIVLELTLVRVGWTFDLLPGFLPLQVIWAIGWSMIVLGGLVSLPMGFIAAFAFALIAGHNALDGVSSEALGPVAWLWSLLHGFGPLPSVAGIEPFAAYALVPWAGVCAAGYAVGGLLAGPSRERRAASLQLGFAGLVAFFLVRGWNVYGDPQPWVVGETALETALSFVNCEKYPPSLAFLLMTLSPALLILGLLERPRVPLARPLAVLGSVPLFYYVVHIYVIHAAALAWAATQGDPVGTLVDGFHPMAKPPDFGLPLAWVYVVWGGLVMALYAPCSWFASVKRRSQAWWLRYL